MATVSFAERLIAWHDGHGRHDLPWQRDPSAYRVWISEVMLQQTRVTTVIPYFGQFTARFPEVGVLAAAPLDEVLALWSGLGYYARARHLHQTAQAVSTQHGGQFPRDMATLSALPGIGRSTAAAILTLAMGLRHPILDGNAKRVLARHHAITGWPGDAAVARALWELAERCTPHHGFAAYTQAIMDLGATLCARARPVCGDCPVANDCRARILDRIPEFPGRRTRPTLPVRKTLFVILMNPAGAVFLERRPTAGIWGGLWAFPECPPELDPLPWAANHYGLVVTHTATWATVRHTLTHLHLDITPWLGSVATADENITTSTTLGHRKTIPKKTIEESPTLWYNPRHDPPGGLATPVARLMARLIDQPTFDSTAIVRETK